MYTAVFSAWERQNEANDVCCICYKHARVLMVVKSELPCSCLYWKYTASRIHILRHTLSKPGCPVMQATAVSFVSPIRVILPYLTQSGILPIFPFFHWTGMVILPYFTQSRILLFCHFSIESVWAILPYLLSLEILLVLPLFHNTSMGNFTIFIPILHFALLPFFSRTGMGDFAIFTQSGILFVLPFFHNTSMGDFTMFVPILNFAYFVIRP